jgi:phosphate transport system substrate-binding protein
VTTCHNPTFDAAHPTENLLAQIAPQPLACQKAGAGPCGVAPAPNSVPTNSPNATDSSTPGAPGKHKSGHGASPNGGGSSPGSDPTSGPGVVTPSSQSVVPGGPPGSGVAPSVATDPGGDGQSNVALIGSPTTLNDSSNASTSDVLGVLAGLLLIVIIAMPWFVSSQLRKRRPTP